MNIFNNKIICDIKQELKIINGQISSLKLIKSQKNEVQDVNISEIDRNLHELKKQKLIFKAQLELAKTEIKKNLLEQESKTIGDRLVKDTELTRQDVQKIKLLTAEVEDLINQLKSLEVLKNEGYKVEEQISEYKERIAAKTCEIKKLETTVSEKKLSIYEGSSKQSTIGAQIFHLKITDELKYKLTNCKLRLRELHTNLNGKIVDCAIVNQEKAIKSEMQDIIKEILHSESFFKIQLELRKSKEILVNLEALKKEGESISDQEINETRSRVEELEKYTQAETRKVTLQEELREAKNRITDLEVCLNIQGMEDVRGVISETKEQVSRLEGEIARITTSSLNALKPAGELTKSSDLSVSSAAVMIEELQKWLAENMIKEALVADVREVMISAALLNLLKKKVGESITSDSQSTQSKITTLAIAAGEKFCMTKVLQYLVSQNPALSIAYGLAVIANHCILGDAQLSTMIGKVKSFMVSELIKMAGGAILGTAMVGMTGTIAAVPAGLYLAYDIGTHYWNDSTDGKTAISTDPLLVQEISSAALDAVAEFAVESIFNKIHS